jgi:hypothetical protein
LLILVHFYSALNIRCFNLLRSSSMSIILDTLPQYNARISG